MSYYTGYEIVIASDNESTLQQVLKELRDNFPRFYYDGGLKKLGNNYIVKINEETKYKFDNVTDFITELVEKYGCKIEVFAESQEVAYFWHFYYDGKMEEPIYESNELNLFYHEDDDLSFLLSTKTFPVSLGNIPSNILIAVVLPAPLGPSSPNTLPGCTEMLTPSRAVWVAKRLTTPRASKI